MPFPVEEIILGKPTPVSVQADTHMRTAAETMLVNDYSQLPIVDDDGKVLGIITNDSIICAIR